MGPVLCYVILGSRMKDLAGNSARKAGFVKEYFIQIYLQNSVR